MIRELGAPLNRHTRCLLITFDDTEIISEASEIFQSSSLKIFTKSDFIGKSFSAITNLVRKEAFDIAILSDRFAQVYRTRLSLQLLASITRASSRYIIYSNDSFEVVSVGTIAFRFFRKVVFGSLIAFVSIARVLVSASRRVKAFNRPRNLSKLAFLRTALAGPVKGGGSVSHIHGFLTALNDLNISVLYCSDSTFPLPFPRSIQEKVVPSDDLFDFFDEFANIHYNFRLLKTLKSVLRSWAPDAIYQRHALFSIGGVILARQLGIPLLLEVNGSEVWARQYWGRLKLRRLAHYLEKRAFDHASRIFAVSAALKDHIISLGIPDGKIVVNPNGVNPTLFNPDIDGENVRNKYSVAGKLVVGFCGSFLDSHGVDVILKAALLLSREENLRFLLIGAGPMKTSLEVWTHQNKLQKAVVFTGSIQQSAVPSYLAACDILLSPHTNFSDGTRLFFSPIKLFEYMAMGKAIVASNLEQIGEVIHDGVNGLLVKPGDPQDLADKILRLAKDPGLRRRLGKQARIDVERNYTWDHNARRVLEALEGRTQ
ncbi:MAG: glycosyltransferase family 4 protein [Bacteroidota bacterium]